MNHGDLAVAIVQRRVMVVQVARSPTRLDRWLDVYTFLPFGDRVFLATDVPRARISSTDILAIFPATDIFSTPTKGMLELPQQAFSEFMELSGRSQTRYENLWSAWTAKAC